MFIEGATKDRHPEVRVECVQGLGKTGVAAFRTLLLTLNDPAQIVKDATASAILKNMTVEDVAQEFGAKYH